jgi:hypothetical protein
MALLTNVFRRISDIDPTQYQSMSEEAKAAAEQKAVDDYVKRRNAAIEQRISGGDSGGLNLNVLMSAKAKDASPDSPLGKLRARTQDTLRRMGYIDDPTTITPEQRRMIAQYGDIPFAPSRFETDDPRMQVDPRFYESEQFKTLMKGYRPGYQYGGDEPSPVYYDRMYSSPAFQFDVYDPRYGQALEKSYEDWMKTATFEPTTRETTDLLGNKITETVANPYQIVNPEALQAIMKPSFGGTSSPFGWGMTTYGDTEPAGMNLLRYVDPKTQNDRLRELYAQNNPRQQTEAQRRTAIDQPMNLTGTIGQTDILGRMI